MGALEDNGNRTSHFTPSGILEFRFHRHLGSASIDTSSPWYSNTVEEAMIVAGADDDRTEFEALMPSGVATWYNAQTAAYRDLLWGRYKAQGISLRALL